MIVLAVLAVLGDLLDPVFWLSSFDDLPPNPSRNQQPVASSSVLNGMTSRTIASLHLEV